MQSYAIGDIHGHLNLLQAAHDLIAADQAKYGAAPVFHLGDLVDRGPNSCGVIQFLIDGIAAGQDWHVLKGNHDRMFTGFLSDPKHQDEGLRPIYTWLHPRLGGAETLQSYGVAHPADRPVLPVHVDAVAAVPATHIEFMNSRSSWLQRGEVIFVHAGIRPGVTMADQTETDLCWIRSPFLEDTRDHGALIVHGHTALDAPTHYGNRLNIDSSAGYGGPLTTVVIEGRDVWYLTPQGRVPLIPD